MSPYLKAILLLPDILRAWWQQHIIPAIGFSPKLIALGFFQGLSDSLFLVLLTLGLFSTGYFYISGQYDLPEHIQDTAVQWAPIADIIALEADIPKEVPLVIWYKENSMLAENPASCTGIMGAYDLVRSGRRACFTPGPISELEVTQQLAIGAREFKERCPEITYETQDAALIKRCYFAYNAGMGAAKRLDPNNSAYVMNNFDSAHQNMVYDDIELGRVVSKQLGAWPVHLAFQSLIGGQWDIEQPPRTFNLLAMSLQAYDWGMYMLAKITNNTLGTDIAMGHPSARAIDSESCLGKPHRIGRLSLRPRLNPVTEAPIMTQDVHGCSYSLPGLDISSNNSSAVLQAPMPGKVTTYTDQWYNSTIRIENDEWVVWLLHPRTYFINDGEVKRGDAVGVMGAVGYATGPHVHYTIYDKINETFVDPIEFLP